MSTSKTSLIVIAFTIRAAISIDIEYTAVSTIITAVSIICIVITDTISNNRGSESSNTVFLMITCAIRAVIRVNVDAAITAIIVAVSIVGPIITETISNNRGNKPSKTVFLMMTSAISAVSHVDVDTTITAIIVAVSIVCLVIAKPISNQCDISKTI
jgi:hypothetical protein